MEWILEAKALTKHYGKGENLVKAVDGVDICIERGEFVTIVGKSGSGKSTLLHLLGGLDNPTSGEVLIDGENIAALSADRRAVFRRRRIGFVFQSFNLIPSLNVWENIVLPIGLDSRKPDEAFCMDILNTLGLEGRRGALPSALSGGQQQRVAIARALASKPAILLADEPTGSLDSRTGDEVLALLRLSAQKYGQTLVVITHNEDIAQMAGRTLVIEDGKVVRG